MIIFLTATPDPATAGEPVTIEGDGFADNEVRVAFGDGTTELTTPSGGHVSLTHVYAEPSDEAYRVTVAYSASAPRYLTIGVGDVTVE